MDVLIRNLCWYCYGTGDICEECNSTGKVEKWISVTELTIEIDKWKLALEWANPTLNTQLPLMNLDNFELPPNINI